MAHFPPSPMVVIPFTCPQKGSCAPVLLWCTSPGLKTGVCFCRGPSLGPSIRGSPQSDSHPTGFYRFTLLQFSRLAIFSAFKELAERDAVAGGPGNWGEADADLGGASENDRGSVGLTNCVFPTSVIPWELHLDFTYI